MNRQNTTLLLACGLALGVLNAPTLAQVAPPPTEPAPEKQTYTPPPKPQPVVNHQPTQPKAQEGFSAQKRSGGDLPINVPYPKLAEKGPDGRILRLRQLPDIAAMRSNPNIGPKSVEAIMPIVYARRNRTELAVIDNLDLYWELSGGMIENLNLSDINEMGRAADMLKPLVPETTLSQDLMNRGILTRVQGGMNQYIVQEYKKAITDEIQVLDGDKGLEEVMRFVLEDSLQEANLAYQGMLAELMGKVSQVVEKSGVETAQAEALKALEKPLSEESNEQYLDIQDLDAALRKLPFTDAIKILTALRQSREFENIAPTIKTINVLHPKKRVMQGDGLNAQIRDPKTGEVKFDSKKHEKKLQEQERAKEGGAPGADPSGDDD